MSHETTLRERIQAQYERFSLVERKLADAVLMREKELLAYSATEIAALAGVSKASTARFFRHLGFADFQAFRQHQRRTPVQPSPLGRLTQHGARAAPWQEHVARETQRLHMLSEGLEAKQVQQAMRLLTEARRIWVVGYRNGYMVAHYAHALLSHLRGEVHLLNEAAAEDAERLADIGRGDVLLAMDFRRRTRRLGKVLEVAHSANAALVLITDARACALASRAQALFVCPPPDDAIFDSYIGAISLINFLATAMLGHLPKKARARMASIERIHAQLKDLEPAL